MGAGVGAMIESLPEGSAVVHVGAASFLSPWREFRASPSQLARLQVAAMLEPVNDMGPAVRGLLSGIEAEMFREAKRRARIPEGRALRTAAHLQPEEGPLGLVPAASLGLPAVPDHERGGRVYLPDPHRSRESRQFAVMEKFDRTAPIERVSTPIRTDALNDSQRRLLEQADNKLASAERRKEARAKRIGEQAFGYGRMTQAERDERRFAQSAYQQLGMAVLAKAQADEIAEGFAETVRLEAARGEDIAAVRIDGQTVTRIVSRDGLETLWLSRALSQIQYEAGLWYRDLYARTERGARIAQMGAVIAGEERDRPAAQWGAEQIARKTVEARIMAVEKANGRAITALRLVVGQGRTINSISGGKSQNRKLNTEALIRALDMVADYRGMQ